MATGAWGTQAEERVPIKELPLINEVHIDGLVSTAQSIQHRAVHVLNAVTRGLCSFAVGALWLGRCFLILGTHMVSHRTHRVSAHTRHIVYLAQVGTTPHQALVCIAAASPTRT